MSTPNKTTPNKTTPNKTTPLKNYHANRLLADRIEKPDTLALRLRRHLGVSQAEFARLLNVHPETIRKYESNGQTPNKWVQPQLERLAKQHGITAPGENEPDKTPLRRYVEALARETGEGIQRTMSTIGEQYGVTETMIQTWANQAWPERGKPATLDAARRLREFIEQK